MTNRNLMTLTLSVIAAAVLLLTSYQLWIADRVASTDRGDGKEFVELRAPSTGNEEIDSLNRQKALERSIKQAIEDFRAVTAKSHEEIMTMGRDVLTQLDAEFDRVEAQTKSLSAQAQSQWSLVKSEANNARRLVAEQFDALETRAEQEWNDARESAANALEQFAASVWRAKELVMPKKAES
jgi:hypothetical protein